MEKPLAIKLRPNSLSECLGQHHLIGENKILSNLVKNKKIFSMILYGKPGIGKTSIATSLVNDLGVRYRLLNATINDKHDFQVVFEEAKVYDGMVLILDEIHRLNKDKQDLLLPQIESGLITLIGMTTSNPFHSINPAIRSRCHLFELKPLDESDIKDGINLVIKKEILPDLKIDDDSINYIANVSGSDLRYAYNLLELAYYSKDDHNITLDFLKSIDNKHNFFHDKNDDGYYDVLSAFQKSIRGSDVNASLHYLGRMLKAEDLESIFRRLTVICYEDIGLANPSMGPKVMAAIEACERIGLPEAIIPLSNVVIELALSPKSNSAYLAINKALEDIDTGRCGNPPDHIKTNSKDYKYPHDFKNAWVNQQYLPDNIKNKKYYIPKETSNYERALKQVNDKLDRLKKES
ncbi:MAG: replication-associated recombination protein A [Bacilli bacterium]|nr:replication-associated recombination protein A [Bacilli bacterium]